MFPCLILQAECTENIQKSMIWKLRAKTKDNSPRLRVPEGISEFGCVGGAWKNAAKSLSTTFKMQRRNQQNPDRRGELFCFSMLLHKRFSSTPHGNEAPGAENVFPQWNTRELASQRYSYHTNGLSTFAEWCLNVRIISTDHCTICYSPHASRMGVVPAISEFWSSRNNKKCLLLTDIARCHPFLLFAFQNIKWMVFGWL